MADILLATKTLVPRLRSRLVNRPHLVQRLNDGILQHSQLTLVSAPAGFGKTTLICEWIYQSYLPVAWISLDRGDNDPVRLMTHLAAAVRTVAPEPGNRLLAMMQSPQPPAAETALTVLINGLAECPEPSPQKPPIVLVLDDYHEIVTDTIHSAILFLLDHLPPQLHLVVVTRVDPPWPLARLRASREITELRAGDLRFAREETRAFLNDVMCLDLSAENISLLDLRTEGWIAGLQMAALSLQGREDAAAFIQAFHGSHRFVLDYLVEEVLQRQPAKIQEFLLKTSILERLTADLCDTVADRQDSQVILTWLEQANLFLVPLDDERRWYRYHHLFADLLRNHLQHLHPDQIPALYGRASMWYGERNLTTQAILYALQASDIDLAEQLVMQDILAVSFYGELYTLIDTIEKIPVDKVRSHPWLSIAYAWALKSSGRFEDAESSIQNIESFLKKQRGVSAEENDTSQIRHMRGHIAALRSFLATPGGKDWSHEIDLARQALELLPKSDLRMRAFVTGWLASLLEGNSDLDAAMRARREAIRLSRKVGDLPGTIYQLSELAGMELFQGKLNQMLATCKEAMRLIDEDIRQSGYPSLAAKNMYLFSGRALYEHNELAASEQAIRNGIALSEKARTTEEAGFDYLLLARVLRAEGNADAARKEMYKIHGGNLQSSSWMAGYVAAWEALVHLQMGNLETAIQWAQESGLRFDDEVSLRTYVKHIILARVLLALGRAEVVHTGSDRRLQEAVILLDHLVELTESTDRMKYMIETRTVQALALYTQGNLEQSLHSLQCAMALAEPEGYVRTFVDEGLPMQELLREAAARGIAPRYIALLLAVLEREQQYTHEKKVEKKATTLTEPLSERELEILSLLRTPLSLSEIADRLIVSENTVRSHVKHIYAKFDVHSRTAAVVRAEELGLL